MPKCKTALMYILVRLIASGLSATLLDGWQSNCYRACPSWRA